MAGKIVFAHNPQYIQQQEALQEIAHTLGVIAFRPDYHGLHRDPNTVLFYLKDDAAHNLSVDREFTQYSRGEAEDLMRAWKQKIDDRYIYRDYIWSFQNTNINGLIDLNYANFGSIQLNIATFDWKAEIRRLIGDAKLKREQAKARAWLDARK